MINQGARTRAMNVEKDFSIALQGQRDQREALNRAQDETRKDNLEYDAFSKEIADQMGQFGKLDMLENDVAAIRGVEQSARSKVAELLRKHGGDVRAFMRAGGGKSALANYANTIKNSKEYGSGVFNAQTFELINKAVEKGEMPNYVDIGTPDMPNLIPMQEAVKLKAMGKIDRVAWNGSFKPMQISDIADMTRNIVNQSADAREATPNEVRAMFRAKNLPDWFVEQQVTQYEKEFFGKGGAKNPLWIDGNQGLRQIRENEENRAADADALNKRLAGQPLAVSPKADALANKNNWMQHPVERKVAAPTTMGLYQTKFYEEDDPQMATGIMVGGRPNNVLIEAKNGSLTGANISGDPQILPGRIGGTVASIEQTSNRAFKRKNMMHKATNTIDRYTGDVMKAIVPIGSGGTPTADGKNEEVYYAKAIMKTPLDELTDDVWFRHTGSTGHTESTKGVFEEYEAWIPCLSNAIERLKDADRLGKLKSESHTPA